MHDTGLKLELLLARTTEKVVSWAEHLFSLLPNLIVAVVVVVLSWLVARLAQRGARAALLRVYRENEQLAELFALSVRIVVTGLGLFIALGVLNLDKTVTSLLAGLGVLGLALGFALQDVTANFMAGVLMSLRRYPFVNGDIIESGTVFGQVENLALRTTSVRKMTGELVIVPNKDLFQAPLTNFTDSGRRRVDLEVGVSYREDLARVVEVALAALRTVSPRVADREPEVFFTAFQDSAIAFEARLWIEYRGNVEYMRARSQMIMALKQAFDDADIKIPFPIRTLEFGDVGGDQLDEMLRRGAPGVARASAAPGAAS